MLAHERLVVKLPATRVDELVGTGDGVRFRCEQGVPMKEWLSLDPESPLSWHELAREGAERAAQPHAVRARRLR
jgi:hypothetical protein